MRNLFKIAVLMLLLGTISSCGIFKKKCDCPKFDKTANI